jgi:hypothetical protein
MPRIRRNEAAQDQRIRLIKRMNQWRRKNAEEKVPMAGIAPWSRIATGRVFHIQVLLPEI